MKAFLLVYLLKIIEGIIRIGHSHICLFMLSLKQLHRRVEWCRCCCCCFCRFYWEILHRNVNEWNICFFFHRFVSINLARYLITHIFSIDCELIALCLACISGLLFVDVCYCYVVQFFVLFIIISFHFILLLFFNRFYLSITWFVRSFFITRKFCCLCFCSRIPQYLLSIAFLLIHFHCVLFIYHIFL